MIAVLVVLLLYPSCGLKFEPVSTLESRRKDREAVIEAYVNQFLKQDKTYESLAFGPLTVYKPEEFHRLDSLYELKFSYEEQGRKREFLALGLQDKIDDQIKIAESVKDKVTYELEHIFSLQSGSNLRIYHDYFILNENDSIIIHDPFYSYEIPISLKNMQLNYLFELHFLTPSERYISEEELNLILFFKQREQELIENDRDLSRFMTHALTVMQLARRIGSLDFVDLTKSAANNYIKSRYQNIVIDNIGALIVQEDSNGEIEEYSLSVQFRTSIEGETTQLLSEFTFSPYLEPINIFDSKIE
jgi:hypothetical protein